MPLLQIRTLLLLLLLMLLGRAEGGGGGGGGGGGAVATTTGATATTTATTASSCRQEIPSGLIRDLWSRTKLLIQKLPTEEKFSRRHRLLPKFCTKCSGRVIGWLEVRELINMYQRSVFSRDAIQRLLPLHYSDLLHRLQHTLQHCVTSSKPSSYFKTIMKLERKIKKRSRDEWAMKAVGEFTFVLRWIDELAQHRTL
ncbi:unnamed protein product [Ophioblennius macclurei]